MIYDVSPRRQGVMQVLGVRIATTSGWHPPYMIRCCLGMKWRQEDAYRTAADARHESAWGQEASSMHQIDRK